MSKLFANAEIDVPCPHPGCGYKTKQTIRRLEQNPKLTCPRCRNTIQIEASDLRSKLGEIDDIIDGFGR